MKKTTKKTKQKKTKQKTDTDDLARTLLANAMTAVRKVKPTTIAAVTRELVNARLRFPKNAHLQIALAEEVGELAQAYLTVKSIDEIKNEALQVATVALRIYEEGDADFGDNR